MQIVTNLCKLRGRVVPNAKILSCLRYTTRCPCSTSSITVRCSPKSAASTTTLLSTSTSNAFTASAATNGFREEKGKQVCDNQHHRWRYFSCHTSTHWGNNLRLHRDHSWSNGIREKTKDRWRNRSNLRTNLGAFWHLCILGTVKHGTILRLTTAI